MREIPPSGPILNRPREAPRWHHWRNSNGIRTTEGTVQEGRIPANGDLPYIPENLRYESERLEIASRVGKLPLLPAVNRIRELIAKWKEKDYPEATPITKELLRHWTEPQQRRGLYFAQQEAILTAVWLSESAHETEEGRNILSWLSGINDYFNEGVPRVCLQMATGSGKTGVMAAIILWQTANHKAFPKSPKYTSNFLAITPGITVKDRLTEGLQHKRNGTVNQKSQYLEPLLNLIPKGYDHLLDLIRFKAANYHQFLPQDRSWNMGRRERAFAGSEKRIETSVEALQRVLEDKSRRWLVFNDEAHHCHRGDPEKPEPETDDTEWFKVVQALKEAGLSSEFVYDLSATPSFIAATRSPLFPWIASQYNLPEAEEAGIAKIMRLPKKGAISGWTEKEAKNLYAGDRKGTKTKNGKKVVDPDKIITSGETDKYSHRLKKALNAIYDDWNRLRLSDEWEDRATPPVIAIVVNSIKNAAQLYRYISEGRGGTEISNLDSSLRPLNHPRTIAVYSKVDKPDNETNDTKEEAELLRKQAGIYRRAYPKAETSEQVPFARATNKAILRTVLNSIGKPGQPGEHIRCIISVGMLTEGWDAKTVTHIIGFRQFGTQLLCEQVSGRALRRVTQDEDEEGFLYPEYADIVGVPFDNLGETKESQGEKRKTELVPQYVVKALPDRRKRFGISWPDLTGYERNNQSPLLHVLPPSDWSQIVEHQVPPAEVKEIGTASRSMAGDENRLQAQPCTEQEYQYLTAKHLVDRITELEKDAGRVQRGCLFIESLALVRTAASLGKLQGPASGESWPNRNDGESRKTAEWLMETIRIDAIAPDGPEIVPVKTEQHLISSGRMREYESRRPHRHETKKSEVNIAVCDSGWEVQVAQALDANPAVSRWIRNERLGWSIPYRWGGQTKQYEPDFVAVIPLKNGRELHLVIEVKGQEYPMDAEKRRWTEEYWIPAVNGDPEYRRQGTWAYAYINEEPLNLATDRAIREALQEQE